MVYTQGKRMLELRFPSAGKLCGQGYCKAALKCVGKICFAQVYSGVAIAPNAFNC
ncbi:hypothetical protein SAMN03159304_00518 [Pseudomonas sp. NFACC24-1]|nr:hypothetical protein SAMN03159304_00518 [Pseudomonas sp. NFACC24-1]